MSVMSRIRERVASTIETAEEAASGAAAKAEQAATGAAAAVREKARALTAEAPSAATLRHAAQAAVDAARNASGAPTPSVTAGKGMGVFLGVGTSAAAGTDAGVGGQISAGYVAGASGELKTYGNTGVVNGAMGAVAGGGLEAGIIVSDVRDFYGDGSQLSFCPAGIVSASLAFDKDKQLTSISVAVGKSTGGGIFQYDTHTEDTTGR